MAKLKSNSRINRCCITALIVIAISGIMMLICSAGMTLAQMDAKYAVILASISVAAGVFCGALYLSAVKKEKGYLNGLTVGIAVFLIVTAVSLVVHKGGLTVNTIFHAILFLISGVIGGILGVNKKGEKYI